MSGGPPWIATEFWDFVAKLPADTLKEEPALDRRTEALLKTFLAEEFKLKSHFDQRDEPVYDLTLAKSGAKVKAAEGDRVFAQYKPGGWEFHHFTMDQLANFLYCPSCTREGSNRPVFNETGLDGAYDFTLNWAQTIQSDTNTGPSIFTALEEQLGLKLQAARAPIDFLIIDHAERPEQN